MPIRIDEARLRGLIEDHLSDALTATGIAYIRPRRSANTLTGGGPGDDPGPSAGVLAIDHAPMPRADNDADARTITVTINVLAPRRDTDGDDDAFAFTIESSLGVVKRAFDRAVINDTDTTHLVQFRDAMAHVDQPTEDEPLAASGVVVVNALVTRTAATGGHTPITGPPMA